MASRNLFRQFLDLIPSPQLLVGEIVATIPADGVVVVQLPGGGEIRARGEGSIGDPVWVRNGVVEGPAPDLPVELIDL